MGDTQSEFRDSQQLVWLGPEDLCQTLAEKEDEQSEVTERWIHTQVEVRTGSSLSQPVPRVKGREGETPSGGWMHGYSISHTHFRGRSLKESCKPNATRKTSQPSGR